VDNFASVYNEWSHIDRKLQDFQRLGDVLRGAAQAERQIGELVAERERAQAAVEVVQGQLASLETRAAEAQREHQARIDAANRELSQRVDAVVAEVEARKVALEAELVTRIQSLQSEVAALSARRNGLTEDIGRAASELEALRAAGRASTAEAQGRLEAIHAEIDAAFARLKR